MGLPNPGSRSERYLGSFVGQDGVSPPEIPESRIEEYLDYILTNNIGKVSKGYYYNGKFYKDSAHTEELVGVNGCLYADLTNNKLYYYNGTTYVLISGGGGGGAAAWGSITGDIDDQSDLKYALNNKPDLNDILILDCNGA